jgi:hypothetical protein
MGGLYRSQMLYIHHCVLCSLTILLPQHYLWRNVIGVLYRSTMHIVLTKKMMPRLLRHFVATVFPMEIFMGVCIGH